MQNPNWRPLSQHNVCGKHSLRDKSLRRCFWFGNYPWYYPCVSSRCLFAPKKSMVHCYWLRSGATRWIVLGSGRLNDTVSPLLHPLNGAGIEVRNAFKSEVRWSHFLLDIKSILFWRSCSKMNSYTKKSWKIPLWSVVWCFTIHHPKKWASSLFPLQLLQVDGIQVAIKNNSANLRDNLAAASAATSKKTHKSRLI